MAEELRDILNWADNYSDKLKSPFYDESHNYHMEDMLNVIDQVYDGRFDEEIVQISKRVTSFEKMSRKKKFIDPLAGNRIKNSEVLKPNLIHPYLKQRMANSFDKKYLETKQKKHPAINSSQPTVKNNSLKELNRNYLHHIQKIDASITPLSIDYMPHINILPNSKTCMNELNKTSSILPNKDSSIPIQKTNYNKYLYQTASKSSNIKLTNNENIRNKKMASINISNVCASSTNEYIIKCTNNANHQKKLNPKMKNHFNDKINLNVGKLIHVDIANDGNKIFEEEDIPYDSSSNEEHSPRDEVDSFRSESVSNDLLNQSLNDVKYTQHYQTVPYEKLVSIPRPEEKLDTRQFLNLYNISIDPEFMEEEIERFSQRLYERINYYIEKEHTSLNIDQYLQKIYLDKQETKISLAHHDSLTNSEQDSYNCISNDVFNDTSISASEKLIGSIVNAFKNTSFHDIAKKELIIEKVQHNIKNQKYCANNDEVLLQSKSSLSSESHRTLDENIDSTSSQTKVSVQNSVSYSEDFVPTNSSDVLRNNGQKSDCKIPYSKSSSHNIDVNLETSFDRSLQTEANDVAAVDIKSSSNISEDVSGLMNSEQDQQCHRYTKVSNINEDRKIPHFITPNDSTLSVQRENVNVSEGELVINISDSVISKERQVNVKDDIPTPEANSSAFNFSELNVVGNDSETFDTGNINIDPSYSEADWTISSGEIYANSFLPLSRNEGMHKLYQENEMLRHRLAFLNKNSTA